MSDEKLKEEARAHATAHGHGAYIPQKLLKDLQDGIAFVAELSYIVGVEAERAKQKEKMKKAWYQSIRKRMVIRSGESEHHLETFEDWHEREGKYL